MEHKGIRLRRVPKTYNIDEVAHGRDAGLPAMA